MGGKNAGGKRKMITVRAAPSNPARAFVSFDGMTVPAAIGRSGRTALKREGDGATPIATMKLVHGYVRGERIGALPTALSLARIQKDMLWCDAPTHPAYNRPVRAPFAPSHERMQRDDGLYDICLVLDWNITSRRRHRGSAIFFHLIRPGYQPTEGCIAISITAMRRLIRFMRPGMMVRVL
jgi:L,D-peptidoglycan transpeptidase YkuD (ErfK/YbiS/YcfS/YnhG family)